MSEVKFCITGGSGFIGTTAMSWAISKYKAINFDIRPPKILEHQQHWQYVDIRDVQSFTEVSNRVSANPYSSFGSNDGYGHS